MKDEQQSIYFALFRHLFNEHDLTLLETELAEIVEICKKIAPPQGKRLEWKKNENSISADPCDDKFYAVWKDDNGCIRLYIRNDRLAREDEVENIYPTIEAAKEAAQEHFNAFVQSLLDQ